MKLYFAGLETLNFAKILKEHNVKNILQSAYYLKYSRVPNEYGFENLLLDSGGYTALVKNMPIELPQYIDYLNKNKVKTAITLDVPDFHKTIENTYELKRSTNTKILPVYHDTEFLDIKKRGVIEKYCADFDYLCLAGLNRKMLDKKNKEQMGNFIFSHTKNKIKVHGLAVTNKPFMEKYPFYSVDSTTWLNPAMFGTTKLVTNKNLVNYRSKKVHYLDRISADVPYWIQLEKSITDLWRARGVEWID
jgi:hypothetical protein